jgi:hypothetical protein
MQQQELLQVSQASITSGRTGARIWKHCWARLAECAATAVMRLRVGALRASLLQQQDESCRPKLLELQR